MGYLCCSEDENLVPLMNLIAVPLTKIDPIFSTILDIKDVPENIRMQLKHFIEHHKDLEEGQYVKIPGWKEKTLQN